MRYFNYFPSSKEAPLFVFFHHAGGNANQYLKHFKKYAGEFEFLLLDLPGRNFKISEPAILMFNQLILSLFLDLKEFVNAKEANKNRTWIFLGHSMGGLIAYELSRLITDRSLFEIHALGISAIAAPTGQNWWNKDFSTLKNKEFLNVIEEFLQFPDIIKKNSEFLDLALSTIRNDLVLMNSLSVDPAALPLQIPTYIYGGNGDLVAPPSALQAWQNLCTVASPVKIFSGKHFFIFDCLSQIIEDLVRLAKRCQKVRR